MSDMQSILGEAVELPQYAPAQPEATAAAPQAEAPPAAQEPATPEQPPEPKVVPLAALHEERGKRRELAAQVEAERRAREELEARFERRIQALAQQGAQQPAPPSPDENPVGYLQHELGAIKAQQQALLQQSERERHQAAQAAQAAQLASRVQQAEAAFVEQKPDYLDAVRHLHSQRMRELQALGVEEFAAERQSSQELRDFALFTAHQGRSPAEVAYALAQARGYAPPRAQAPAPDPAVQIKAAQRGTAAAASLGNGGGQTGAPSARALLEMSDDEFAEATSGEKWRRMMGG